MTAVDVRGVLDQAVSTGPRPSPPGPFYATRTFAWRTTLKLKHVPEQLLAATFLPVLNLLIFTYLYGGAIAGSPHTYLAYIVPGVLVMGVAITTTNTGVALNTDILRGVFDRFRSLPLWRPSVLVGSMFGDAFRYVLASVLPFALGLALGYRPHGGVAGVVLALLFLQVFGFSLAWLWTSFGMLMREPTAVQGASFPLILLLVFCSNIQVRPHTMPGWLQAVVNANPVTHVVTLERGLLGGTATAGQLGWALLSCGVLVVLFAPPAIHLYNKKNR